MSQGAANRRLIGTGALIALAVPAAVLAQQPDPSPYQPPPAVAPGPQPVREPDPEFRRTFVARPLRGRVLAKEPGDERYAQLTEATELRLGSSIDARNGRVRIIVARNDEGNTYRSNFFSGKFNVTQDDDTPPLTTIVLAGGSYGETCRAPATAARSSAAAQRRSRRKVRRLWADGRGRFRTRGRYSAATVRGTRWLTEDRCDGTVTMVERGEVVVEDFTETDTPAVTPTPEPDPTPVPTPGPDGAPPPLPQAAPPQAGGEDRGTRRPRNKRVRVKRGKVYVAGPTS